MTFHCACGLPQKDCDFPFCKSGTEEEQKRALAFQAGAASRDAEVAKLKDDNEYLYVAAIERDQLREQVAALEAQVERYWAVIQELSGEKK